MIFNWSILILRHFIFFIDFVSFLFSLVLFLFISFVLFSFFISFYLFLALWLFVLTFNKSLLLVNSSVEAESGQ